MESKHRAHYIAELKQLILRCVWLGEIIFKIEF